MNNLKIKNLVKLDLKEMKEINGGNELTDTIWRGIGNFVGQLYNVLKMTAGAAAGRTY